MTKHDNVKYILLSVVFFLLFLGSSIGAFFAIRQIARGMSTCVIEEYTNRHCYEANAKIMLEQYFKIDGNRTGFVLCGPVLNCLTSPCSIGITVGDSYNCILFRDDVYWINMLGEYPIYICLTILLCLVSFILVGFSFYYIARFWKNNSIKSYEMVDATRDNDTGNDQCQCH
jgi:uncharacterized protein YneF (UPF0154 family)